MTAKDLIQNSKVELGKALKAIQTGETAGNSIQTVLTWLEGAQEANPTQEEKDEIQHIECLAHCTNEDYTAAYDTFKAANSGREIPTVWRDLGIIIYVKVSLPTDLTVALTECNLAITWLFENEQQLDMDPIKAILYGRKAFCHLRLGQVADTIACCNIASRLLPEHLAPLRIMAEIKLIEGNPQAAIEYLSLAIANRPQSPHFWDYANRGNAFLETGNLREALSDLRIALELDPNSPVVLSNLGLVMNQMGNFSEASTLYNQALQKDYYCVPARNNRGTRFFESGDYRRAEQEFSTALRLDERNASLWFNRALSRFEQEMYGECLLDIARTPQLAYQSWETRYMSGMCKGRLQEYSTAISILKTLALDSGLDRETTSLVWNNMGVIEHRTGNLKKAHSCFQEAVGDNPLNEQAQANLERLESSMSGAELQATQEEQLELFPLPAISHSLQLTPSDVLSTVNIVTSLAALMT